MGFVKQLTLSEWKLIGQDAVYFARFKQSGDSGKAFDIEGLSLNAALKVPCEETKR